jgi:alpha-beta hydrolase superfamily lysophospholipase
MKRIAIGVAICLILQFGVAAALVGLGRVLPPEALKSVTDPFAKMDLTGLPPVERYKARDGAELSFRTYKAGGNEVAVLIHGSAGSSSDMHLMAKSLADAGVRVFVPDLRGHGANHPHGDVSYTGQLDDDMADFLEMMRPKLPWFPLDAGGVFVRGWLCASHRGQQPRRRIRSLYPALALPEVQRAHGETGKCGAKQYVVQRLNQTHCRAFDL